MVKTGKEMLLQKNQWFEIIGKPQNTEYLIKTQKGEALLPVKELLNTIAV
jgi:hypothetical protein